MGRTPRDDFYVLMWNSYDPLFFGGRRKAAGAIRRFREMGCNGGTLIPAFLNPTAYEASMHTFRLPLPSFARPRIGTSPFLENRFPFYVMNVVRPLYLEWGAAKPVFRRQYQTFDRRRNRRVFTRVPCVNNPAVSEGMSRYTREVMRGLAPVRDLSLLYDLRDEPSITSFLLAADTCFCRHCMKRMRQWLKDQYSDVPALNAQWGTRFRSWQQVEPLTTQEAIERREAGNWNFSSWHDHRAFMNDSFVGVVREQADLVRRHDPEASVGLAGTQCPWVYGGYDFSKLVPELDWAEPYAYGGSLDCFRSFKRHRAVPLLKTTGLGGSAAAREAMLWSFVFQSGGYAGTIIWQSNAMLDVKARALPLNKDARRLGQSFRELRSGLPRLLQRCRERSSPVAVHYSHASIEADFIVSVPPRWPSVAASEPERYPAFKTREAWWKLLEDQGLRPTFISSAQVEAGALLERGVKVFVLPRSIALSNREARQLRAFVAAGGTLIADSFVGRMDERCKERKRGALDALLGIRRIEHDRYHASEQRASLDYDAKPDKRPKWGGGPLRAECSLIEERIEPLPATRVLGCTEYSDTPLGLVRESGKGQTVLFNCAPLRYIEARRTVSGAQAYLKFFGGVFQRARIKPELEVRRPASGEPVPGWQVFGFVHGKARYFGVAPDMGVTQDVLGAIQVARDAGAGMPLDLIFPVSGHIYEARSGAYLGRGSRTLFALEPASAPVFTVLPYKVRGIALTVADGKIRARIEAGDKVGEHVFRFDVIDAKGVAVLDKGANVVARRGTAEWPLPSPLPRRAKILCRDVATGVSAISRLNRM